LNEKIIRCGRLKNVCFLGLVVLSLAGLNLSGRTPPDASDPVGFFSSIADKMLRSTFSFGVTNIPVYVNGQFVYSPAVNRLLQLAANIYDASNTNFFPSVFRPCFNWDVDGNLFITGYTNVDSIVGTDDPRLSPPLDVSAVLLPTGTNVFVNVYGVPWIIGAKKGFPNFNQLYMVNSAQVTRKLMVSRNNTNADSTTIYKTNQMYVMSITNNLGISFWNSYSNDYPRPLTVYASDWMQMTLTNNGVNPSVSNVNFIIPSVTINAWPGSHWGANRTLPPNQAPNPGSFYFTNWTFTFLPQSIYRLSTGWLVPDSDSQPWETNNPLWGLDHQGPLGLMTTNYLQAFILDGNNVVDYVQLRGPIDNANLNQVLADPDYTGFPQPRYQWSTNLHQAPDPMPDGVYNQIEVSKHPDEAPGNSWIRPPGMPSSLYSSTPGLAESAFFNGFFVPTFQFGGQTYVNTQLTILASYMPRRTLYEYTLWQVNDPLVHYLASDLSYQDPGITGWHPSDATLPVTSQNSPGQRYQPWGATKSKQMAGLANVDPNPYNLADRDPLIWSPENWDFPTNQYPTVGWIGRVHRGTPWQTVYLKATNILNYANAVSGVSGLTTWMQWTGDFDVNDAALMAPVNDWRLAGLLMSLLNTNDATQLFSVNDPNTADWLNVLNGLTVYSNSVSSIRLSVLPPAFDTYVMWSNSPSTLIIANGIAQARAIQPNQNFYFVGDVLAAPELTENSPWLNTGTINQLQYGITDAAYEAIPAQLLSLLRPDSIGTISPTNGGWNLQFSGSDALTYELQDSTDLVNWHTISTNHPVQGYFNASPSQNSSARFYRSVLMP
jgi:hypothetical protein